VRIRAAAAAAVLILCFAWAMPASARVARPSLAGASAAIVVDARSGEAMLTKQPDARRPIASTTKLMTALLVLESGKLNRTFTAPAYHPLPAESRINLRQGERMKGRDLLTALLLESANDAAVDLAVGVAGSRSAFVAQMNRRANQLGLRNTHYANPIGLDAPGNYSSARDLAALTRRLLANPIFAKTVDLPVATLRSGDRPRTIRNRNLLVGRHRFVDGVKTGHTIGARYILVGAAHGNGGKVVSVVLGEPSEGARDTDTLALLRWGVDQYRRVTILRPGRTVTRVKVKHRDGLEIRLTTRRGATFTLRRGEKLATRLHVPKELEGPIAKDRRVGSVDILYLGRKVKTLGLVTTRAVPGSNVVGRFTDTLGPLLTALALLFVVLGGALAGLRLRAVLGRDQRTVSS
jgi:D-alanyl-D-alanine carboxypeptidase (penicillin-binding protein 5/6)